ncbi:MAG: hypothetical protein JGK30_15560 [Microcoleus sp. PH2017_40_RAT_O_B]|uniref:hypothetical protein n=1 Tax=unclassified Microcoleus TaxID=2642155 RepID=UPI001DE50B9F|nr:MULTISPECIES: hypothetical protein [unclassified Microcoleus]MCC3455713.1 hypothetical protein [Microcoleus sp. PH2017_08_TRC_O_A]MCC3573417.1 hypothetical protein [Microcoleus sp. PH2017_34_RAT_O_A]MCC3610881.1 hypothetical protein [Microcoleus sp. PH2017_40_RAT_O_B]
MYAIGQNSDIPIGTQDAELLDTRNSDEDADSVMIGNFDTEETEDDSGELLDIEAELLSGEKGFKQRAQVVYGEYQTRYQRRFKWLKSDFFDSKQLKQDLLADARSLIEVLQTSSAWHSQPDEKLAALVTLIAETHPNEKILIFTQFADTVRYITDNLTKLKIAGIASVTGKSKDPTEVTFRFSPTSNNKRDKISPE